MKNLLVSMVAVLFATSLTFGQHQSRPLPIYRYMVYGYPDNLNAMDSSAASLAIDTTSLPYPVGPALTYGGWDTAHIAGPYNWVISPYHPTASTKFIELKGNGYKSSTSSNIVTDQWYISPYFNTNTNSGVEFSFSSKCAKFAGPAMVVMVSTKFRNEVVTPADWTVLTGANIPNSVGISAPSPWLKSNINLDSYKGDSVCIAFRYTSNTTANGAATFYVDSIQITGNPLGINDINQASALVSLSPNPSKSNVTVSYPSAINKIEIYNMVGDLVLSYENINSTIYNMNIEKLQQGIYFTKIQLKNGISVSKKIVRE